MKKKMFAFLCSMILCFMMAIPTFAESSRLVDDAQLLTSSEASELLSTLNEISERQQVDIVVVTVNSLDGKSAMDYADDYYDYNHYKKDGILFLISMGERDWWISTTGYGITAVTDAGLSYISEEFLPDLSDGNYYEAFTTYAELCDEFITQAKTGNPYDVGNLPKKPFDKGKNAIIGLVIGIVVAFFVTGSMKAQLKTVRSQSGATNYIKQGSMKLNHSSERFLYRNVMKREKPKETSSSGSGGSSTHKSSSGTTHGGGGGKF